MRPPPTPGRGTGKQTGSNLGLGFHLGPGLEQVADHVRLAGPGGHVERRLSSLQRCRDGAVRAELAGPRSLSPTATHHVGGVGRRAVVGQRVDDVLVAHEGGHVNRSQAGLHRRGQRSVGEELPFTPHSGVPGQLRQAAASALYLGDGLEGSSVLQQELHHLGSVLLAGDVERSETVLHREAVQSASPHAPGTTESGAAEDLPGTRGWRRNAPSLSF